MEKDERDAEEKVKLKVLNLINQLGAFLGRAKEREMTAITNVRKVLRKIRNRIPTLKTQLLLLFVVFLFLYAIIPHLSFLYFIPV